MGGAFSVSPALGWAGVKGPKGSDLSRQTEGVVVGLKATGASLCLLESALSRGKMLPVLKIFQGIRVSLES